VLPSGGAEIALVQSSVTVAASAPSMGGVAEECAPSQRLEVMFDYPGPGRPTPAKAVAPLLGALKVGTTRVSGDGDKATVTALDSAGNVVREYRLTKASDGWWPDGYTACKRRPTDASEAAEGSTVGGGTRVVRRMRSPGSGTCGPLAWSTAIEWFRGVLIRAGSHAESALQARNTAPRPCSGPRDGALATFVCLAPDLIPEPLAVAEGFEPSVGLHPQTLSRRSP
jgi:hypothetical protein